MRGSSGCRRWGRGMGGEGRGRGERGGGAERNRPRRERRRAAGEPPRSGHVAGAERRPSHLALFPGTRRATHGDDQRRVGAATRVHPSMRRQVLRRALDDAERAKDGGAPGLELLLQHLLPLVLLHRAARAQLEYLLLPNAEKRTRHYGRRPYGESQARTRVAGRGALVCAGATASGRHRAPTTTAPGRRIIAPRF